MKFLFAIVSFIVVTMMLNKTEGCSRAHYSQNHITEPTPHIASNIQKKPVPGSVNGVLSFSCLMITPKVCETPCIHTLIPKKVCGRHNGKKYEWFNSECEFRSKACDGSSGDWVQCTDPFCIYYKK